MNLCLIVLCLSIFVAKLISYLLTIINIVFQSLLFGLENEGEGRGGEESGRRERGEKF